MTSVFAKHPPYDDGHLGEVVQNMKVAGAPTIRVVRFNGELYALEGSHRLAAAAYLGVIPKVVVEMTDVDALPDEHWHKVGGGLPEYEFEHVLALDLSSFKMPTQKELSDGWLSYDETILGRNPLYNRLASDSTHEPHRADKQSSDQSDRT